MDRESVKKKVCDIIEANRDRIVEIGRSLYAHPELGYKEVFTSGLVKNVFDELGIEYQDGLAATGIKAKLKKDRVGPNVAIIGELDAVVCPEHPYADKETGAAHCCGHFAQITTMLATAMAFSRVKDEIDGGNITFLATPAEECVEVEWRKEQIDRGRFKYLGGKQELIHRGVFDDIDMSVMVHATNGVNDIICSSKNVGFVVKSVKFIGKEAHAGAAPWAGVNALNAASLALMAINSIRETLQDKDCIRIHPIITKGGTLVNIVPDDVRMEMYIRGANIEAIKDANAKVNRAIRGSAYAIGCEVVIDDLPGYLPIESDLGLAKVFEENVKQLFPDMVTVHETEFGGAAGDIGDVMTIMPCLQGGIGGFINNFHSKNFDMANEELAFIAPAKALACTVIDLLADDGAKAKEIIANFDSPYNTKNYDTIWEDIMKN